MRLIIAAGMMIFSLALYAAPDKMRGVRVGDGGSLSVQEMAVPRAGVGEVLIKVRAAGVNPVDWKVATAPPRPGAGHGRCRRHRHAG